MIYSHHGDIDISDSCYLLPYDKAFEMPSDTEVHKVIKHLFNKEYTVKFIADTLGVEENDVYLWINEMRKESIPKSCWIVLTQLAGLTLVTQLWTDEHRKR